VGYSFIGLLVLPCHSFLCSNVFEGWRVGWWKSKRGTFRCSQTEVCGTQLPDEDIYFFLFDLSNGIQLNLWKYIVLVLIVKIRKPHLICIAIYTLDV
jgi:hypothetical protein